MRAFTYLMKLQFPSSNNNQRGSSDVWGGPALFLCTGQCFAVDPTTSTPSRSIDAHSLMIRFRRNNTLLNQQIRYRAEVTGRRGFAHSYESVEDVQHFLARARPPATSPSEALMRVDPSLTLEKAEALAGGGTVPPSPVELHNGCDRAATGSSAKKAEFETSTT